VDLPTISKTLNDILGQVAGQSGAARVKKAGPFDPSAEFATLGVNSVDLMEFILRVEKEFRLDVLGDLLPDELPTTLDGWAVLVQSRLERAARST
jgi:acyl carrier protein